MNNTTQEKAQSTTMLITNDDTESAFRLFYNRATVDGDNINQYINMTAPLFLQALMSSSEFLSREGVDNLIINAAKKIQDLTMQAKVPAPAPAPLTDSD